MARTSAHNNPAVLGKLPSAHTIPALDDSVDRHRPSDRFLGGLSDAKRVVFLSHVHPDPDSLGSMLGLAHLVESCIQKPCVLTQDGSVHRAENRLMIDLLHMELEPIAQFEFKSGDYCVFVDSQPCTGRHTISKPPGLYAVLDHHITPGELSGVPFTDIRPELGATCTLATKYLIEQLVELPEKVATALMYGIETEITGFPREATDADDEAIGWLYPHVDQDLLAQIRHARLPRSHFECIALALKNAIVMDRVLMTWVDPLRMTEEAAEVVDFLIRDNQLDWAICVGVLNRQLILSLRAARPNARAGEVLRRIVGTRGDAGGHERRAGGCITLPDRSEETLRRTREELIGRVRAVFGAETAIARPLVPFFQESSPD